MQESIDKNEAENTVNSAGSANSTANSYPQHAEADKQDDTDADAFAILSLLLIIALTIVYYLNP